jgi:hypothetical protein
LLELDAGFASIAHAGNCFCFEFVDRDWADIPFAASNSWIGRSVNARVSEIG